MNNEERINTTLGQLSLYACADVFTCDRSDVAFFVKHFLHLKDRAEEVEVWISRHNALLEQVEASRPSEYRGNGEDLPPGTVVKGREGDAWQRSLSGTWWCATGGTEPELSEPWGPYSIIYTPKEES